MSILTSVFCIKLNFDLLILNINEFIELIIPFKFIGLIIPILTINSLL